MEREIETRARGNSLTRSHIYTLRQYLVKFKSGTKHVHTEAQMKTCSDNDCDVDDDNNVRSDENIASGVRLCIFPLAG